MKRYNNKVAYFNTLLEPGENRNAELYNLFNIFTQERFNRYLAEKIEFEITGEISPSEDEALKAIKADIKKLQKLFPSTRPDRLEFDLAKIFHTNLCGVGFGRFHVDDVGMWRWMSMQYFKEEAFWRRGKVDFDKAEIKKAAKATYEHCVGKRNRDIFPRRYFIIGQRLYDVNSKYTLLDKLAEKSRAARAGGFGNLISNLVDSKLISPNDYVSKTFAHVMFTDGRIGSNDEVQNAFVRYNAYRSRLLNRADENIFKNEICLMSD